MSVKDFLIKCLSSSEEVSFGRTLSGIAFLTCLLWDTFFVAFAALHLDWAHMTIHDILPTTDQLHGQIAFCAGAYGINKVTELITAFSQWKNRGQQQ